ncbi:hypothetical protein [Lysobacter gummosus]
MERRRTCQWSHRHRAIESEICRPPYRKDWPSLGKTRNESGPGLL